MQDIFVCGTLNHSWDEGDFESYNDFHPKTYSAKNGFFDQLLPWLCSPQWPENAVMRRRYSEQILSHFPTLSKVTGPCYLGMWLSWLRLMLQVMRKTTTGDVHPYSRRLSNEVQGNGLVWSWDFHHVSWPETDLWSWAPSWHLIQPRVLPPTNL